MSAAPGPHSSDPSESTPQSPKTDAPINPSTPRTIPQRELRNDSSRILREGEQGAEFIITNRGRPVAQLTGIKEINRPRLAYTPASRPLRLGSENRIRLSTSTEEILDAIREERV